MKKNILLTIGTILFVLCNASAQLSTFDSTAQGWTGGFNLTHFDSLGNPGGYISSGPQQGDWYWNAPSNYLGNKTSCIGNYLSFDFKTTAIQGGGSLLV